MSSGNNNQYIEIRAQNPLIELNSSGNSMSLIGTINHQNPNILYNPTLEEEPTLIEYQEETRLKEGLALIEQNSQEEEEEAVRELEEMAGHLLSRDKTSDTNEEAGYSSNSSFDEISSSSEEEQEASEQDRSAQAKYKAKHNKNYVEDTQSKLLLLKTNTKIKQLEAQYSKLADDSTVALETLSSANIGNVLSRCKVCIKNLTKIVVTLNNTVELYDTCLSELEPINVKSVDMSKFSGELLEIAGRQTEQNSEIEEMGQAKVKQVEEQCLQLRLEINNMIAQYNIKNKVLELQEKNKYEKIEQEYKALKAQQYERIQNLETIHQHHNKLVADMKTELETQKQINEENSVKQSEIIKLKELAGKFQTLSEEHQNSKYLLSTKMQSLATENYSINQKLKTLEAKQITKDDIKTYPDQRLIIELEQLKSSKEELEEKIKILENKIMENSAYKPQEVQLLTKEAYEIKVEDINLTLDESDYNNENKLDAENSLPEVLRISTETYPVDYSATCPVDDSILITPLHTPHEIVIRELKSKSNKPCMKLEVNLYDTNNASVKIHADKELITKILD